MIVCYSFIIGVFVIGEAVLVSNILGIWVRKNE